MRARDSNLCNGKYANLAAGAIVSVEVGELAPGGMLAGESEHVGVGACPVTEHVNWTAEENPPCSEIETTSVTCPPGAAVSDLAAGLSEKSGGGLNVAKTVSSELKVIEHLLGSVPVHAPLQPPNTELPETAAAREMELPGL